MKKYAVLGQPVAHSLSPQIHQAFASQFDLQLDYQRLAVSAEDLNGQLDALFAQGYAGLNLTLPHKLAALAACESLSEGARRAGAVNTLVRGPSAWQGDNTDGAGLVNDLLKNQQFELRGTRILVLGAGGAARGILGPLLQAAPQELVLSSRSPLKPQALVDDYLDLGGFRPCSHYALKGDRFDLVINATSLGHAGTGFMKLPAGLLDAGALCLDLSYGQPHAAFRSWALAQGTDRIADGFGMLVEQAALAFARWHGQVPDTSPVLKALRPTP